MPGSALLALLAVSSAKETSSRVSDGSGVTLKEGDRTFDEVLQNSLVKRSRVPVDDKTESTESNPPLKAKIKALIDQDSESQENVVLRLPAALIEAIDTEDAKIALRVARGSVDEVESDGEDTDEKSRILQGFSVQTATPSNEDDDTQNQLDSDPRTGFETLLGETARRFPKETKTDDRTSSNRLGDSMEEIQVGRPVVSDAPSGDARQTITAKNITDKKLNEAVPPQLNRNPAVENDSERVAEAKPDLAPAPARTQIQPESAENKRATVRDDAANRERPALATRIAADANHEPASAPARTQAQPVSVEGMRADSQRDSTLAERQSSAARILHDPSPVKSEARGKENIETKLTENTSKPENDRPTEPAPVRPRVQSERSEAIRESVDSISAKEANKSPEDDAKHARPESASRAAIEERSGDRSKENARLNTVAVTREAPAPKVATENGKPSEPVSNPRERFEATMTRVEAKTNASNPRNDGSNSNDNKDESSPRNRDAGSAMNAARGRENARSYSLAENEAKPSPRLQPEKVEPAARNSQPVQPARFSEEIASQPMTQQAAIAPQQGSAQPAAAAPQALAMTPDAPQTNPEISERVAKTQEAMAQQIVRGIQGAIGSERSFVGIRLHPASLGRIYVQLTLDGSGLSAQITAQKESTRALLENNLSQLRASFEDQNIRVERMAVSRESLENRSQQDQQRQGQGRQQETDGRQQQSDSSDGRRQSRRSNLWVDYWTPRRL